MLSTNLRFDFATFVDIATHKLNSRLKFPSFRKKHKKWRKACKLPATSLTTCRKSFQMSKCRKRNFLQLANERKNEKKFDKRLTNNKLAGWFKFSDSEQNEKNEVY